MTKKDTSRKTKSTSRRRQQSIDLGNDVFTVLSLTYSDEPFSLIVPRMVLLLVLILLVTISSSIVSTGLNFLIFVATLSIRISRFPVFDVI